MKMNIKSKDFMVQEGVKVDLKKWPTLVKPVYKSKKEYSKYLQEQVEELSDFPGHGCGRKGRRHQTRDVRH
jgi:hypothetical protein